MAPFERNALLALPLGVCVFDAAHRLVLANPAYWQATSLPPGRFAPGSSHAEVARAVAFSGALGEGDPDAQVRQVVTRDRRQPWRLRRRGTDGRCFEVHSVPLPGGGHLVCRTEITAHALRHAEAETVAAALGAAFGGLRHGVAVWGPDRRLLRSNRRFAHLLGLAAHSVTVGLPFADLLHLLNAREDDAGGDAEAFLAEQLAHDRARPATLHRARLGGTTVEISSDPLPDGGWCLAVADVSDAVRQQHEAVRHGALADAVLHALPHGICVHGPDQAVRLRNRRYEQLVPGAVPGLDAAADAPPGPVRHQRPDGGVVEISVLPLPDGGHVRIAAEVGPALVPTPPPAEADPPAPAPRNAAPPAKPDNAPPAEPDNAKGRFLAIMGGELRGPLNAVIGFSDALARTAGRLETAHVAEYAGAINAAGRQLLGLVDTVLDVARIEAGRFDLRRDPIDPDRMLRAAIRTADPAAAAGGVTIAFRSAEHLPAVLGDERRLRQALEHLLGNAVRLTPSGGQVAVDAALDAAGWLRIEVADTGAGIAPELLERMLEPFAPDDDPTPAFSGAGLGLYICRALVQAHDGTLHLHSQVGRGTVATIRLPPSRLDASASARSL